LVGNLMERIRGVRARVQSVSIAPRVFCMEWLAPPYNTGHWMPELVEMACGEDRLSRKGKDSTRISWEAIQEYAPDILLLCPCGYDLEGAVDQAPLIKQYPGWDKVPAVIGNRVYAVDANSYFARPGPRVIDGLELLAHLLHPDRCEWTGPSNAYRRIDFSQ
jgi:iron complex transport system substrate-binding protein